MHRVLLPIKPLQDSVQLRGEFAKAGRDRGKGFLPECGVAVGAGTRTRVRGNEDNRRWPDCSARVSHGLKEFRPLLDRQQAQMSAQAGVRSEIAFNAIGVFR